MVLGNVGHHKSEVWGKCAGIAAVFGAWKLPDSMGMAPQAASSDGPTQPGNAFRNYSDGRNLHWWQEGGQAWPRCSWEDRCGNCCRGQGTEWHWGDSPCQAARCFSQ